MEDHRGRSLIMASYRVVAPLVLVRDERGRTHHAYEGSVVEVVDADHAAYLVAEGMLRPESGQPTVVAADDEVGGDGGVEAAGGDPAGGLPSRPPHVAAKARWVDYAVTQGFDRVEAEGMSKQALIAALA